MQVKFSKVLGNAYKDMMDNFIVDRQETDTAVVNLTVQIFSVKSISHMLFEEENILAKIVDFYRDLVQREYFSGLKPKLRSKGMKNYQKNPSQYCKVASFQLQEH